MVCRTIITLLTFSFLGSPVLADDGELLRRLHALRSSVDAMISDLEEAPNTRLETALLLPGQSAKLELWWLTVSEVVSVSLQNRVPSDSPRELAARINDCMASFESLRRLQKEATVTTSVNDELLRRMRDEERRLRSLMGLPKSDGRLITPTSP